MDLAEAGGKGFPRVRPVKLSSFIHTDFPLGRVDKIKIRQWQPAYADINGAYQLPLELTVAP